MTTNNSITNYTFGARDIRVLTIDGNPWFIATDVLSVLGMDTRQSQNYLRYLHALEQRVVCITLGKGNPNKKLISESGLYKLIMRCNKPEAAFFQNWVTQVVLPSIRKHGGYISGQEKVATGEMSDLEFMARAVQVSQRVLAAMNNLSTFTFNTSPIRVVDINGNPWFMAVDVTDVLEMVRGGRTLDALDDDQVCVIRTETVIGSHPFPPTVKRVKLISESGLYKLVMRSDKPQAKPFKDWVTKIVLPAIRKDGGYISGEEKVVTGEMDEDELVPRSVHGIVRARWGLAGADPLPVWLSPARTPLRVPSTP